MHPTLETLDTLDTKLLIPFLIKLDIFVTINTDIGACGSAVVKALYTSWKVAGSRPDEVNESF
jgi:hypothetical protein